MNESTATDLVGDQPARPGRTGSARERTASGPAGAAGPAAPGRPVLTVRDLTVDYRTRAGTHRALHGVDLDVRAGEVVAVVGESGSGKSTLGRAVIGLLARGGTARTGSVRLEDREVLGLPERRLAKIRGRQVGFVPQDPMVSLDPLARIGSQIAEALVAHTGSTRPEAAQEAVRVLERAGIDRPELRARQYPHELSGGMRQRVLIGIALACTPQLVIADEPTSALDVLVQRRILDYLTTAVAERSASLVLITHDLAVAAERADRIVVMREGRIVETGDTRTVMTDPREPYTRQLLHAAPALRARAVVDRDAGSHITPDTPDTQPPVVLAAHGLSKVFGHGSEEVRAVDDVALSVRQGRTHAIVGGSGSGKTTLARMLLHLEVPTAGSITVDGLELATASRAQVRAWRRRVQLVYQSPLSSLSPFADVREILTEPLRAYGVGSRAERTARTTRALDEVRLPSTVLRRRAAELSGGQQQRVALARALILDPRVVVLDEATSALDVSVQEQILTLLVDIQRETGISYVFISHDLAVVRQVARTVSVMQHGRIVEDGPVEQVFDHPTAPATRQLLDAIPRWRT